LKIFISNLLATARPICWSVTTMPVLAFIVQR